MLLTQTPTTAAPPLRTPRAREIRMSSARARGQGHDVPGDVRDLSTGGARSLSEKETIPNLGT